MIIALQFPFPFTSTCLPCSSCACKLPTELFTFIHFLFRHVATMGEAGDPIAFDKLFKKSVPHILEKIFLSLDYESFKTCVEVSNFWNELLTSDSFKRIGASLFLKCLEKELHEASENGNLMEVKTIITCFMVDVNCIGGLYDETPLYHASLWGHKDVVTLFFDREADPNEENGSLPLNVAAIKGQKDVVQLLLDREADPNKAAVVSG